jgi:oligoendopeptidase F
MPNLQQTTKTNQTQTLTFEELMTKLSDPIQENRDRAAKFFNEILEKHKKVAEHELNAVLQHKKVEDELRNYERPDSARLLSDDISADIVDTLLETVQKHLQISRDFYKFKATLFGKEKLAYHERNLEYGKSIQTYTFEEGVEILRRVFKKLDGKNSDFSDILEDYLAGGKIDVMPRVGKRGGAFMTGSIGRIGEPTFIFLNWTGTLNDVQTFAHEMGHACNHEMMKQTEIALTWENSHLTAESPSTFMEDFVLLDILENTTDNEQKLAILMKKLNDDVSAIFRQISLYLFELELHREFRQSGYLSSDKIGELFQKSMANYMGDGVEKSAGSENWWIYWSHIRNFFYVYSYGAGLLISKFMQNEYKQNPDFMVKIKEFYRSGMTTSPVETLNNTLGIDPTQPAIWEKGQKETAENLKMAQEIATKLGLVN